MALRIGCFRQQENIEFQIEASRCLILSGGRRKCFDVQTSSCLAVFLHRGRHEIAATEGGRGSCSSRLLHRRVTGCCVGLKGGGARGEGGAMRGNTRLICHLTAIVSTVVSRLLVHSIQTLTHTHTRTH